MECEICKIEYDFLKNHHIQSKCYNGSDKEYNRVYICDKHHEMIHYGLIILEGWFGSMNGRTLVWRKFNEKSITELEDPKVWLKPNYKIVQEKYLRKYNAIF